MADALGLIGSFLGGAGGAAENVMIRKIQGEIDDQKAQALEAARAANEMKRVERADELRRAPGEKVAKDIAEANKEVWVDDGVGGGMKQAPTKAEQTENRLRAMEASGSEGLIGSAAQARATAEGHEIQRESLAKQERMGERQIESHEKLAKATNDLQRISIGIQDGQLKLAQERAAIEDSLKTIQYVNAQTVKNLQDEYMAPGTTPERKKEIKDQQQMLTGKDNDKWIPVPTGYDEMTGKPTGYKMFNKADGTWEDPPTKKGGAGVAPPPAAVEALRKNPKLAPEFRAKYGADPAQFLPTEVPGRPLYNAKQSELKRLAGRPKGVSAAQAAEADQELALRRGESRISG